MKVAHLQENLEQDNQFSKIISTLLHSESTFVYVGANQGELIFQILQKIERISIYAIEPDLMKFEQLKQNSLKWEKKVDNKIYALNIAMSDRDGQESFIRSQLPNNKILFISNLSHIKDEFKELSWEQIPVDIFTLDTLFKPIKPTLIKIDVGGDELKILQGSVNILKEGKTLFLINLNHQYTVGRDSQEQLYKFMKAFDYTPKNLDGAILFVNQQKRDRYKFLVERSKKLFRKLVPATLRYQLKNLIKK
ncbi:MAG: FkbM family methyltransferase [Hydrococcus sp. Prado102]|jgi:FkbM family methyltransferase|nr:FkbM family methyltransferase [Hydrococcus sp. Prado102]